MTKVTGILALLLFATLATALSLVVFPTMWGVRIASSAWRKVKHSFVTEIVPLTSSDLTEIEICSDAPIVYLIHGTFAPAATWTHEKSPLCQALMGSQSANNDAPILQRIQWGGANTVAARLDGISQLRERLARIVAVNPSRRVALIGHSHGGNIALKAAEAFTELKSLNIVTMATPFLLAQKRPMALVYRLLAPALSGLLVLLMLLTALAVLDTPIWLLISTSLAGSAGSLAVAFRMFNRRDQHTIELPDSAIDKNWAARFADRTLVVTRTGDEADGSLKIASFVNAWLATSLRETALVRGALTWAERAFADPVFELTKAFDNIDNFREVSELFMRRERLALYHWNKRHTLSYQAYELLRIAFANRIGVIEDLIAIGCASLILKSIQFAFGTKSGFVSVAALVTSSETPPGFWTHFQSIASVQPGDTLLSHSQIYEDSAVQGEIAQWLATQFEGKIESAINANLQCRDRLV